MLAFKLMSIYELVLSFELMSIGFSVEVPR